MDSWHVICVKCNFYMDSFFERKWCEYVEMRHEGGDFLS